VSNTVLFWLYILVVSTGSAVYIYGGAIKNPVVCSLGAVNVLAFMGGIIGPSKNYDPDVKAGILGMFAFGLTMFGFMFFSS